jgi:hypothetical protein
MYGILTPKGPKAIFRPFLKFGQAIVKAIFIKNSWIKLWIGGLVVASRRTNFYKIPIFGLVLMSQKKENSNYQHYNILSAYEVKNETFTSSTYVSLVFYSTVKSRKVLVKK